jgi:hypothetical protein
MNKKDFTKLIIVAIESIVAEAETVPGQIIKPQTPNPQQPVQKNVVNAPSTTANTVQKAPVNPQEKPKQHPSMNDIQYKIFSIKNLIGKLKIAQKLSSFSTAFNLFNKNVTRFSKDTSLIKTSLYPLKGSAEALVGDLQSLITQLEQLEKSLGE